MATPRASRSAAEAPPSPAAPRGASATAAGAWHGAGLSLAPLVPAPGWGGGACEPRAARGFCEGGAGVAARQPRREQPRREYLQWPPPRASCRAGLRRCRRGGAPGQRRGRGGGAGEQRGGGRRLQPREKYQQRQYRAFQTGFGKKVIHQGDETHGRQASREGQLVG